MKPFILLAAAMIAAPALAQSAPVAPAAPAAPATAQRPALFSDISPEGRATLQEAFRAGWGDREAIKAARTEINALIGAEKLDVNAVRRAMEAEQKLVRTQQVRRQEATLAAVQKLSAADRKAFAVHAERGHAKFEGRAHKWRKNGEGKRHDRGQKPPRPPAPTS